MLKVLLLAAVNAFFLAGLQRKIRPKPGENHSRGCCSPYPSDALKRWPMLIHRLVARSPIYLF
jgi:hypothetical protein